MKWQVILAKERTIMRDADNLNEIVKMANEEKTDKEKIVNIKLMRGTMNPEHDYLLGYLDTYAEGINARFKKYHASVDNSGAIPELKISEK